MALTGVIVWGIQEHRRAAQLVALQETVEARFEKIGKAYQAQGRVVDAQQLAFRVKELLGPELAREISRQGGRVIGATQASGLVPATTQPLQPVVIEVPGQVVTVPQDRGGLPALTSAQIVADPSGLRVGWINREERFKLAFASWRTGGDGLRAAARLTREVDGQAEEIHLTAAEAYFPASEIQRLAPSPKFSLAAGLGKDSDGHLRPSVLLERHFSRNWSVVTGYANGGSVVMGKYTWGHK
jgi:hypothetical protein